MRETITGLANWPVRKNGQPLLRSTHEALLYAQLIYGDEGRQSALMTFREEAYKKLRWERRKENPNPQTMMDLAVRAQLFREAFMECLRIKSEEDKPTEGKVNDTD